MTVITIATLKEFLAAFNAHDLDAIMELIGLATWFAQRNACIY